MMSGMRQSLFLLAFAALAACGKSDSDPGPGGVTVDEARALGQAAEMIEQRRMTAEALRPAASPPVAAASAASAAP
jgi:hypothetical protein